MAVSGEQLAEQIEREAGTRAKAESIQPLRRLFPFLRPYRLQLGLALLFLVMSSGATLVLPVALRRVIDISTGWVRFSIGCPDH